MRLIDADALKEGIACHKQWTEQEDETDRRWAFGYNAGIDRALFNIACACAHAIEAEPVRHGEWIDGMEYINSHWKICSQCHATAHHPAGGDPYCHNCGAKMGKGDAES